jgi:hypothetical protein
MTSQENFEVFRITPEIHPDKCYEHAEYMTKTGTWSAKNERYFTSARPRYVGRKIRFTSGGYGDNSWQTDYFENEFGEEIAVPYSYEGRTCFREVECRPRTIPTLEEMSRKVIIKNLKPSDIEGIPEVVKTVLNKEYGGKIKKSRRRSSKKHKTRRHKNSHN